LQAFPATSVLKQQSFHTLICSLTMLPPLHMYWCPSMNIYRITPFAQPFSAQVTGDAIIQEIFQDHFQNLSRQANLLNLDDLTIFMPTTVLCAVRQWQRLRKNCEGQDRHISSEESKAAISKLPNWKAGDHGDMTVELQTGGTELHNALWKMLNIVWTLV
jgi:hypothetical protein